MVEKSYVNSDGENKWYGQHVILDLYGVSKDNLINWGLIEGNIIRAAKAANATILHSYFHPFANGGVSGAVILQESHISIHTWPETGFAAVDVYMCGDCDPLVAIKYIIDSFQPITFDYVELKRGITQTSN